MEYRQRSVVEQLLLDTSMGRRRAEYAYTLAELERRDGRMASSFGFAEQCIDILRSFPQSTMTDCATTEAVIAGVALPSLLHEDVVRDRFSCFPQL